VHRRHPFAAPSRQGDEAAPRQRMELRDRLLDRRDRFLAQRRRQQELEEARRRHGLRAATPHRTADADADGTPPAEPGVTPAASDNDAMAVLVSGSRSSTDGSTISSSFAGVRSTRHDDPDAAAQAAIVRRRQQTAERVRALWRRHQRRQLRQQQQQQQEAGQEGNVAMSDGLARPADGGSAAAETAQSAAVQGGQQHRQQEDEDEQQQEEERQRRRDRIRRVREILSARDSQQRILELERQVKNSKQVVAALHRSLQHHQQRAGMGQGVEPATSPAIVARAGRDNNPGTTATASAAAAADPPDHFICPISQDVFCDPVVAADGHTYEWRMISRWLNQHRTSPITNLPLYSLALVPNHHLRSQIMEWADRNQRADISQRIAAARSQAPEGALEHVSSEQHLHLLDTILLDEREIPPTPRTDTAGSRTCAIM
jgi:hypothetical protein